MTKRVLLLDLDTPCFAAAAVAEKRSVEVTHNPSGKIKIFKTRTEFKDRLKEKGALDKLEEYSFKDIQIPEPIENACHILKSMVKQIETAVEAEESRFYISGQNNFRDNLELPTKYKSSRTDLIRPVLLKDVRKFALNKFNPEECHLDEADDRIIYRAYEIQQLGYTPIVATIDKDARAYSGIYLYNQDNPDAGINLIPRLGSLYVNEKNAVKGDGFLWYCHQMLVGDSTDSYKPTELAKIKFGEKSSFKALEACKTEKEALETVLDHYRRWYPSEVTYTAWNGEEYTKNWFEIASLYHKCVRMKETKFDDLNFSTFCKRFDVEVEI